MKPIAYTRGQTLPTLVVFGDEGSIPLLGAYTLEGFGLAADPINRRLVPVRGLAMSCALRSLDGRGLGLP